jgi:predicted permease
MTSHGFPASARWFRFLLNLYPADFRDDMGEAVVESYRERAREAFNRRGAVGLLAMWCIALVDAVRNGLGERWRPAVVWRRTGDWGRDLERVHRRLRQKPMFVAAVLATLTVGLGAFAVVYTAVDKILFEPLPYRDPDDLYMLWFDKSRDLPHLMVTGPQIVELHKAGGAIADAAGMTFGSATLMSDQGDAQRVDALSASDNLFDLLGVKPALGRTFRPADGTGDAANVVVLSDGLWKRFGGDPGIVGRMLTLSGTRYTVIGVMAEGFWFAGSSSTVKPDVFVSFTLAELDRQGPTDSNWRAIVRARHGTSAEQFRQTVDRVGRAVIQRDFHDADGRLIVVNVHRELVDDTRPALVTLGFAAIFLVLALTVNLASLLLARAAEREREFAVARALGASGSALVRATLLEGAVLGFAGGLGGALVGWWGARALVAIAPLNLPRRESIVLDGGVGLVVVITGLLLGLLAAAVPAIWMGRLSLGSLLAAASVRGVAASARLRRGLVIAQVSVSLVLLTTGGLVMRSFERLLAADPGFRPEGVLTFSIGSGNWIFPDRTAGNAFQDRLEAELSRLPGVIAVSAANQLPLSGGINAAGVRLPGAPGAGGDAERESQVVTRIFARRRYANALGMRIVAGDDFAHPYRPGVREVLIDTHLANRFFPQGRAVGAEIDIDGRPSTIVGVVEQARLNRLDRDDENPQLYVRVEDYDNWRASDYVVRTTGDPHALASSVQTVVRRLEPRIAMANVRTMDDIVAEMQSRQRISAVITGAVSGGALLLVAMGIFGVISGSVIRRRGELAVRIALGATQRRIVRLVVSEGARLVAAGTLIAIPGMYLAGCALRDFLVGVSPFDPLTLTMVTIGLAAVAILACYMAARPAAAIEPEQLLRDA